MSKMKVILFVSALLLAANSGFAANYGVGSCNTTLQHYSTIMQAVNSVPSGSTITICPGAYYEQVVIAQPLTLKGVVNAGSSSVVIFPPAGSLTPFTSAVDPATTLYPVITVTAGPVNISNITVDGNAYAGADTGILYYAGSSGTMSQVTVRNLSYTTSWGIWMESTLNLPVVLQNSSVHDVYSFAVLTAGNVAATVKNNVLSSIAWDLVWNSSAGSASGNYLKVGSVGIVVRGGGKMTQNTIDGGTYGLAVLSSSGFTFTSNKISNTSSGIYLRDPSSTAALTVIKANTIFRTDTAFALNCTSATVSGNFINDSAVGMDMLATGPSYRNTFANVGTMQTGYCP